MIHLKTILTEARTLRKGNRGEDVKQLQKQLIDLGYLDAKQKSGKPADDGIFGPSTKDAVIQLQKSTFPNKKDSWQWDGVVGKNTRSAIADALKKITKQKIDQKGDDAEQKQTKDAANTKPYPYRDLEINPTPELIIKVLKGAKGSSWYKNDNEAWVEAALRAIKDKATYEAVNQAFESGIEKYILSFMNPKELEVLQYSYKQSDPTIRQMLDNFTMLYDTPLLYKDISPAGKAGQDMYRVIWKKRWESLIDSTKSVNLCSAPELGNKCASFVYAVDSEVAGIQSAWKVYYSGQRGRNLTRTYSCMDSMNSSLKDRYDKFFDMNLPAKKNGKQNSKLKQLQQDIINNAPGPELTDLKPGSYVGMFWPDSSYHQMAFVESSKEKKYSPFSTHIGIVIAVKDGTPIILHEVGGTGYADPYDKLIRGAEITWIKTASASVSKKIEDKAIAALAKANKIKSEHSIKLKNILTDI